MVPALNPDDFSAGSPTDSAESSRPDSDLRQAMTLDQANSMLPLVRSIAIELADLSVGIAAQQDQILGIEKIGHGDAASSAIEVSMYRDELDDVRASIESDRERLQRCISELESLGVQVHRPIDGSVDFPGRLGGRKIHWCWRIGEASIQHWHEVGEPLEKRRPIASVN